MQTDLAGMIWHELFTTDPDAAVGFYTQLLDAELEVAPGLEYRMLKKDGRTHAGFVHNPSGGAIPSTWYPYIHVVDVDAAVETATAGGARLIHGPQDVGGLARFAVLGDPQHATFGLMSSDEDRPEGLFVWDELHATDVDPAASFYGSVAGWTTAPFVEEYRVFNAGEAGVAGLMKERSGSQRASWLTYFGVDDTDATAAKAMELGAGVIIPPESMEQVGRYAVLTDPTGAAFGLHQPPGQDS
jgi:hypothetical protein